MGWTFKTENVIVEDKMFGLSSIIALAVGMVFSKFPNELKDCRKNCSCLFELSEMVTNELATKHGELFVEDSVKDFVNYKDLTLGDKALIDENNFNTLVTPFCAQFKSNNDECLLYISGANKRWGRDPHLKNTVALKMKKGVIQNNDVSVNEQLL